MSQILSIGSNPQAVTYNDSLRAAVRFYYAQKFFRAFTFVWLYWNAAKFVQLLERPSVLFSPGHFMAQWLVPVFPAEVLFWLVLLLVGLGNGWNLFLKPSWVWQTVVALGLLWINLLPWSYGAQSHVNQLFLLAHLFLVCLNGEKPSRNHPNSTQFTAFNWFYRGLLFTYTLSGLWKVPSLLYKIGTQSADVHWLGAEAALRNARTSFLEYDLVLPFSDVFVNYAWAWQLGFVAVVYLQVTAVVSAARLPLRPWVGAAFIGFHLVNQFAFLIFFVVACFTLLFLFFPYEAVFPAFRQLRQTSTSQLFTGSRMQARYERKYAQAPPETYTSFEAYRQKLLDRNYYLFGILYLPGLRTVVEASWRLLEQISGKKTTSLSG